MWRQHGLHNTGTTGGNSLHQTQQWMEPEDDDDDTSAAFEHIYLSVFPSDPRLFPCKMYCIVTNNMNGNYPQRTSKE